MEMFAGRLALVLVLTACATPPVAVTTPGPGVPHISEISVEPDRFESGCPITFRLKFEDGGRDVTRAVSRWRIQWSPSRHHEDTEVLPVAPSQLQGKLDGGAEVVVVPPHAGNFVYQIQLEDAQGQTSNVAEARVSVELTPLWRQPRCQATYADN